MGKVKSHMGWSWILMMTFFMLSILDIRFGILGFICMIVPVYHAMKGRGKVHCSHYCPRGSFLSKFMNNISFNNNLPKPLRSKVMKNIILGLMITLFTLSLIRAQGDIFLIGLAIFRLMLVTSVIAVVMGVVFRPRSWCQVCPMGHVTGLIKNSKDNKTKKQNRIKTDKAA